MTLSRTFRGSRGELTLSGSGNGTRYHYDSDLNRFGWGAGIGASQRLGPRTVFVMSEQVVSAYTRDAALVSGGGVLLPLTSTFTSHGAAEISRQTSTRTSLAANVRYDRVDFPEEDLPDGAELALGARFSTRLSAADAIDLVYVHQRNTLGSEVAARPLGARGVERLARHALRLRSRRRRHLPSGHGAHGGGRGPLRDGRRRRCADARARCPRATRGPSARRSASAASARATSSRWRSTATSRPGSPSSRHYGYGRSHDVFDPTFVFEAQGYEGGLRFSLGGGLGLTAAYGRRQSSTGDEPAVESGAAHLSLTYAKGF